MQRIKELEAKESVLLDILTNPLTKDKRKLVEALIDIKKELIHKGVRKYYCRKCGKIHRKGKFYQYHKAYAEVVLDFKRLKFPTCETTYKIEIRVIIDKSRRILSNLQKKAPLIVKPICEKQMEHIMLTVFLF